jgi:hypothetical protein
MVRKIVDASVRIIDEANHEHLEMIGSIWTDKVCSVRSGGVSIEETAGYLNPNDGAVRAALAGAINGVEMAVRVIFVR